MDFHLPRIDLKKAELIPDEKQLILLDKKFRSLQNATGYHPEPVMIFIADGPL